MISALHQTLRTACQPYHTALEQTYPLSQLLQASLSPEMLGSLLQGFYACHLQLHAYLQDQLQDSPLRDMVPFACRLQALRQDLATLACPLPPVAAAPIMLPASHSAALGVLYVLLGSNLGSMMIAKRLAQHADARIRQAHHFYGEAAHTGLQHWQALMRHLAAMQCSDVEQAQLIAAAIATFQYLQAALSQRTELA